MNLGKVKEIGTFIKCLIWGASDSRTAEQSLPHGIASKPVIGRVAVYSKTENNGRAVILGYVDATDDIQSGELKLYATNSEGVEQSNVLFTNDGYCEFMGDDDNFVRYSVLNTKFNELKSDFNALVSMYNAHIHITTATVGATTVLGVLSPTVSQGTNSTASIADAKISHIKTYKSEGN